MKTNLFLHCNLCVLKQYVYRIMYSMYKSILGNINKLQKQITNEGYPRKSREHYVRNLCCFSCFLVLVMVKLEIGVSWRNQTSDTI